MNALEQTFAETMPSEMGYDYAGMSFQEKKAQQGVSPAMIFGMSLLFVLLLLAALYENWTLPFSLLLGTPIAIFGAYAALWARGMENNVYAQIGLVMLIGLAAKNVILIVEFAKLARERGTPLLEAALEGARLRLRPIIRTSFAFILGCVPLWLASGSGAVARRVTGTTVIGGMLAATLIAIFLVPVMYNVIERFAGKRSERASAEVLVPGEPSVAGKLRVVRTFSSRVNFHRKNTTGGSSDACLHVVMVRQSSFRLVVRQINSFNHSQTFRGLFVW